MYKGFQYRPQPAPGDRNPDNLRDTASKSMHFRTNSRVRPLSNGHLEHTLVTKHEEPSEAMYSGTRVSDVTHLPFQKSISLTVPKFIRGLFGMLIPSFLVHLLENSHHSERAKTQSRKIASLDGLRGIACLFVFHAHYAYSFSNCLEEAGPEVFRQRIMYQPFISLLWSGIGMVNIFFFVSGYVLVGKAIKQIRNNDVPGALLTISSSVFRRALRLYIPSMAIIMIAAGMAHMRLFDAGNIFYWQAHQAKLGPQEAPPLRLESLVDQLYDGLKDCYRMLDNTVPWGRFNFPYVQEENARPVGIVYDKHLWTIPVEFKCSMLIFMILIATARLRSSWRILVHAGFAFNCLMTERYSETLFVSGMVFAEIDSISDRLPPLNSSREIPSGAQLSPCLSIEGSPTQTLDWISAPTSLRLRPMYSLALFTLGLFLLSIPPQEAHGYPAYRPALSLVPLYIEEKDDFIRVLGAIMATWPVATSPIIAPLFGNPVAQYLGQISFALYLVHGSIIKSLWYWLQPSVHVLVSNAPVSEMTTGQFVTLWIIGYVIVFPVVLWLADVFWRLVDQRSISLARLVEERLTRP